MRFGRLAPLLVASCLAAASAAAQQAVARVNVNLRSGPSPHAAIMRVALRGTVFDKLDGGVRQRGYMHVRTGADDGWVFALFTRGYGVDPAWDAPAPVAAAIVNASGDTCAADGSGTGGRAPGDTLTNTRKNRTDVPASSHDVAFQAIVGLPYPANHEKSLENFKPPALAAVMRYEGRAVMVEGYLADVKSEGPEQTNCGAPASARADVDWHSFLVEHRGDAKALSVIAEMTPRTRPNHSWRLTHQGHAWTLAGQYAVADSTTRVRLTGWLLLDPEHYVNVNGYAPAGLAWRATIWELHPVSRIEVCQGGRWVDLDTGPGDRCGPWSRHRPIAVR